MAAIDEIIRRRTVLRQQEAGALARAALDVLHDAGMDAWLVGSLARGTFQQHSDIDILIDVAASRRSAALRLCLGALRGFPSSIVFKADLPPDVAPYFLEEATDRARDHQDVEAFIKIMSGDTATDTDPP